MRCLSTIVVFGLLSIAAFAKPALVVLDRDAAKPVRDVATILREHGDFVFAAAEPDELAAKRIAFQTLDAVYTPGHYLLIRRGQSEIAAHTVLWADHAAVLVRTDGPAVALGGQTVLETVTLPPRESYPPSHLDDPALDAWLAALAARVNADTLFSYVSALAAYNRYTRWTSNDQAVTWIRDRFQSYGIDSVYLHPFTASGSGWSRTANNVIAVIPGAAVPDSIVLIGGHMDATSNNVSVAAPGAEDNATGTAGVLEAARLLRTEQFRYTLMFVAFNGEEQGLQGSAALAQSMAAAGRNVAAMLNMDMIGYYDPAGNDLWIEGFYSGNNSIWLANVLWDNCLQFTTLTPYLYPSDGFGSDHVPFHNAGYPAVLTIENEYGSYACYHRTCDLPDQITPWFLREMALLNILTAAELAGPLGDGGISGAVTLEGTGDFSGVRVTVVGGAGSANSETNGAYLLDDLLPGTYALAFSKQGWISDTLAGIAVTAGNITSGQNIHLLASTPGSVSGTVILSGGGDVTAAIAYIDAQLAPVNADGSYTIAPVYSGQHVVTAALNGFALGSAQVTLAEGGSASNVNITLYPLWDFEASNYGLNNNGTNWQWGTDGIAGSHSPTRVWGTVLGGNYANCGDYRLNLPPVSLAHQDSARLTFWHWYDIEPNGPTQPYDGANVAVAPVGVENWQVITPLGGYPGAAGYSCNPLQNQPAWAGVSGMWLQVAFDLNAFLGQTIRIRLQMGTDVGVTRRGWYVDDMALLGWHSVQAAPPPEVSDVTVYPVGGDIELRWSAVSGAVYYKIYRGGAFSETPEGMELLSTQPGTAFVDTNALALPAGFYLVIAGN